MKLLLAKFGFTRLAGIKGYLSSHLGRKKVRLSPQTQERIRFEEEVKSQFVELKKKGLSIPIFTL